MKRLNYKTGNSLLRIHFIIKRLFIFIYKYGVSKITFMSFTY